MFARIPRGGSTVILTAFCKIETGKVGDGIDVSHNRKDAWVFSAFIPSHKRSRVFIHDAARWQFCRHTQVPLSTASMMAFSAMGPCPCPRTQGPLGPRTPFWMHGAQPLPVGENERMRKNHRSLLQRMRGRERTRESTRIEKSKIKARYTFENPCQRG